MSLFKITINAGTPATYDPPTLTVYVGDSIFWFNSDLTQAHWPAPKSGPPNGFMQHQIAPNSSSNQFSVATPGPIDYVCNNHPGAETGRIIVKALKKKKGPFGPKTKKGPFGPKTKKGPFAPKSKKGPFAGDTKKGAFGTKTKY
jgi:hypothetical protein